MCQCSVPIVADADALDVKFYFVVFVLVSGAFRWAGSSGRVVSSWQVSNLNRQFLFREHNVGQAKSTAAATAAKSMNANIKVREGEMGLCCCTAAAAVVCCVQMCYERRGLAH